MCGICGQLRFDGRPADSGLVLRMREALRHRGLDDQGFYSTRFDRGGLSMGHTRLAILDLSSAGHQPMSDSSGRYHIVFNGEVYNYLEIRKDLERQGVEFRSHTDTEVVLAAYARFGPECLRMFNGMYAFALWDDSNRTLFCARDRLGVKPFYYSRVNGVFCFASEMKCLLLAEHVRAVPDPSAVYDYLTLGMIHHGEDSLFADIRQLPAGSYLQVGCSESAPRRYWQLPEPTRSNGRRPDVEQLQFLLNDSVRLRMRSDVPVGILLSGGLDSSTLTAIASRASHSPLQAFSLRFDDPSMDESHYARRVADHCAASLKLIRPEGRGLWEELDDLIRAQDAPTHAPEVYSNWCMMRAVSGHGIKVLLCGQGGDEIFGGYNWYPKYLMASLLCAGKLDAFFRELRRLPTHFPSSNTRHAGVLIGELVHGLLPSALKCRFKPEIVGLERILKPRWRSEMRARDVANLRIVDPRGLETKMRQDLLQSNVPQFLHYEDANSMAFGLEERVPFLDYRLVEWAQRVAVDWRIHNGVSKYMLRLAMADQLPPEVVARRTKMGLSAPGDRWLQTELRQELQTLFAGACRLYDLWIERSPFLDELGRYLSGRPSGLSRVIWRVINLEKWLRIYF